MRFRRLVALPGLAALLASCWWIPRPAVAPMRTVSHPGTGVAGGDLIVFLPGRGDRPEDFERRASLPPRGRPASARTSWPWTPTSAITRGA